MTRRSDRTARHVIVGIALGVMALGAIACGERAPQPERAPAGAEPAAAPLATDSVVAIASGAPMPAFLARACVAGDPEQGEARRLDSVPATVIPTTAIEALPARDSARFAARIARLVDILPSDTGVADFHGLPVSVRAAWRLAPADGDTIVVAIVVRRMPIESAPLEEVFTIVATPGQRSGVRDALVERWVLREVGHEDELAARELAGAFLVDEVPILALVEDLGDAVRTALVVRRAGRWLPEWAGALAGCTAP